MSASAKKILGLVALSAALVIALAIWHLMNRPDPPRTIADFDHFQQDLADRVREQFGDSDSDFSVVVAAFSYPVGVLLRPTGTLINNGADCIPQTPPKPFAAHHLFPSYTLSTDTALQADIGSHALNGLSNAGVNLHQSQYIQSSIADAEIQSLDDKSVELITTHSPCSDWIRAHPGDKLIRGYVTGKITFTLRVSDLSSVKERLAKLGSFSIHDNPQSSTVSVADQDSEPIVALLSEVGTAPNPVSASPRPSKGSAPPPPPSPPEEPAAGTHIFVQMDALDAPTSGQTVVNLLRDNWPSARVESNVEKIPSKNAPDSAQVRYFNQADIEKANRCASILGKEYPNARAVRIGLPGPKGQLEVWLPMARASGR